MGQWHVRCALVLSVFLLAGCDDGDDDEGPGEGERPTAEVSGTVTTPDGSDPSTLLLVAPGIPGEIDGDGAWTAEEVTPGARLVGAMHPERAFALMTFALVDDDGEVSNTAITIESTAVALVLMAPTLLNSDAAVTARMIAVAEADANVATLAALLEQTYGDADPTGSDAFIAAHGAAVESVTDTLLEVGSASDALTARESPLIDSKQIKVDVEWTLVEGPLEDGSALVIKLDSENSIDAVDWHATVYELDVSQFADLAAAQAVGKRDVFQRGPLKGTLVAGAKNYFRYAELFDLFADLLSDDEGDKVAIEDRDGLYEVRAYSGAFAYGGDNAERDELLPALADGAAVDQKARVSNFVVAVVDGLAAAVPLADLVEPEAVAGLVASITAKAAVAITMYDFYDAEAGEVDEEQVLAFVSKVGDDAWKEIEKTPSRPLRPPRRPPCARPRIDWSPDDSPSCCTGFSVAST